MTKSSIPTTIAEFAAFLIGFAGIIALWFVTP